ncbi:MAG: serine/threonine protein kinase [Coriobacteriia bacterium]|nr:serine/threonine protein kinase [Coriobacteriia bacterium]
MPDDISRRLAEELHAVSLDNQYTVEETLRESEAGRTEKVRSADGTIFIRKYLRRGFVQTNEYALLFGLQGADAPFPRIISLYELAEFQVVIMEYLDGPTLQECVEQYGSYEPQQAARWALGMCGALCFLHTCSASPIIHRDIKPAHVILQDGQVKLIDFGIARTWKSGEKHDTEYLGTRGYAAPEQFGYSQTDVRTDIYACGATLYFLLTGEQFDAQCHGALEKVASGATVESGSSNAGTSSVAALIVPPDLARIICRCTEFSPDARYQSIAELIAALQEAMQRMQLVRPVPAPAVSAAPQATTYQPVAVATPGDGASSKEPLKKHWVKDILIAIIFWPFYLYLMISAFTDFSWIYQKYGAFQFAVNVLEYWVIGLLFVLPCYLLLTNPLRIVDRIRFFTKKRIRRIALTVGAFFLLMCLCLGILTLLQPSQVQADISAHTYNQSTQNH